MARVVTAALACGRDDDGHIKYLYAGQPVDGVLAESEISRLVAAGFVAGDVDTIDSPATHDDESEPARPQRVAPKADWLSYAEAQGIDGADEMTKAELVDLLT